MSTKLNAGTTFTFSIVSTTDRVATATQPVDPSTRVFLVSDDAALARSIGLVMGRWVASSLRSRMQMNWRRTS